MNPSENFPSVYPSFLCGLFWIGPRSHVKERTLILFSDGAFRVQKHRIQSGLSVPTNMLAPARKRVIDLSHLLAEGGLSSYCTGHPRFNSEQVLSLRKDGTNVSRLILGSHTGTHLDAPIHFLEGAPTISDVDLSTLVGPAVVIDVRGKEPHGAITWDDIGSQSEQLSPETILLFCTGWSRHWGREDYTKSPHLTEDAARKIIERGVRTVGIDVFDIDGDVPDGVGVVETHPIHRVLLGSGVLIAENLTNVEVLLDGGTYIVSLLPLNLEGCDGSPIRAIAWSG
ncbi:putative cyclase [Lactarius pseudohatsudake]|nr:putative cyclase [Lactarius pseudohatsudake]